MFRVLRATVEARSRRSMYASWQEVRCTARRIPGSVCRAGKCAVRRHERARRVSRTSRFWTPGTFDRHFNFRFPAGNSTIIVQSVNLFRSGALGDPWRNLRLWLSVVSWSGTVQRVEHGSGTATDCDMWHLTGAPCRRRCQGSYVRADNDPFIAVWSRLLRHLCSCKRRVVSHVVVRRPVPLPEPPASRSHRKLPAVAVNADDDLVHSDGSQSEQWQAGKLRASGTYSDSGRNLQLHWMADENISCTWLVSMEPDPCISQWHSHSAIADSAGDRQYFRRDMRPREEMVLPNREVVRMTGVQNRRKRRGAFVPFDRVVWRQTDPDNHLVSTDQNSFSRDRYLRRLVRKGAAQDLRHDGDSSSSNSKNDGSISTSPSRSSSV